MYTLFLIVVVLVSLPCFHLYRYAYRSIIYQFPFDSELNITELRTIPNGDNSPFLEVVIIAPEGSSEECIDDWKADGN